MAELLLAHSLRRDRAHLYAHSDEPLDRHAVRRWRGYLRRALGHEPVAYITHSREFYGLDFYVDRRVLIPRPETELLVAETLAWARRFAERESSLPSLVDVGTGSGAIAVALAAQLPGARLYAVDLSTAALAVARRNAVRHGVAERIVLLPGSLLQPLPEAVDLIVANLPYVSEAEMAQLAANVARHEPRSALAGGPEGLDLIRHLLAEAPAQLRPGGAIFLEIGAAQGESALNLARASFPAAAVAVLPDLAGLPRLLRIET
ncbi:MAG: peptide chain release factor N(5)-glutamine methyltransferase [Chloroflexi bacterium]|nr:peptide chain release factor N(5)-glutamine methyltransferase [Chloroflexota bacterium]